MSGAKPEQTSVEARCQQLILERIENADVELLEISFISGRDDQIVDAGRRGNHGVLDEIAGFSMHDTAPIAKASGIQREYLIGCDELLNPELDFGCFGGILLPGSLDAELKFADGYGRKKHVMDLLTTEPGEKRSMRTAAANF
jgi:hypothetical protein